MYIYIYRYTVHIFLFGCESQAWPDPCGSCFIPASKGSHAWHPTSWWHPNEAPNDHHWSTSTRSLCWGTPTLTFSFMNYRNFMKLLWMEFISPTIVIPWIPNLQRWMDHSQPPFPTHFEILHQGCPSQSSFQEVERFRLKMFLAASSMGSSLTKPEKWRKMRTHGGPWRFLWW